ncbi:hypothetical protein [Brasilonema sp. UFV-L1]|uniref:hypothetical protein n=1 Tax=Brasilonema sp. UFV-L1 TaxID=2234130 RepID=UPI00145DB341|nr:hypothetical protein [Brasilonema sp. UFV-L1]
MGDATLLIASICVSVPVRCFYAGGEDGYKSLLFVEIIKTKNPACLQSEVFSIDLIDL